ncbi:MAG: hypothetical protein LC118_02610 [Dehalococcoidia bacterium]|nr:hypothetical protein [Dehalococcoidia bacterium]
MPLSPDLVGQVEQATITARPADSASLIFYGAPDVFSTMALGGLIEAASARWLERQIADTETSVGAQIVINHTAATPIGMNVTAEVRVVAINGRRVDFEWTARDAREQVGNGTHSRFVLDRERFLRASRRRRIAETSQDRLTAVARWA